MMIKIVAAAALSAAFLALPAAAQEPTPPMECLRSISRLSPMELQECQRWQEQQAEQKRALDDVIRMGLSRDPIPYGSGTVQQSGQTTIIRGR